MHLDDDRQHRPHEGHFTHTARVPACDHCTYFKGIVYRSLHIPIDPDQRFITHDPKLAHSPRSLLSVALEEEAIEKREHEKYLAWSRSRHAIAAAAQTPEAEKTAKSLGLYAKQNDTLAAWIEGSTKEELLAWLERNGDDNNDMTTLRHEGIYDLRKYIMSKRTNKAAQKTQDVAAAKPKQQTSPPNALPKPTSSNTKKTGPRLDALVQRLQAHTSLKPPQAALRQREELTRWYDSKKAPLLKDELRHRGIKPVPSKKVDMIALLVEDDKK